VARLLCEDERVKGVHFTGSTRAGRAINELVAPRFVRAALEMGGVNAAVVFPDADVEVAADSIIASATALAGQKCTAVRRVLVHRDVAGALLDELGARMESLVVGRPNDPDADVGPMISGAAQRIATEVVEGALNRGGRVVATAGMAEGLADAEAYFAPVVLTGLASDDPLNTEETFAPILLVEQFGDHDDVWANVNASGYGLAAAVYTGDLDRVAQARARLSVGVLAVNGRSDAVGLEPPFGGRGLSGNGLPEGGEYAYAAVTDTLAMYQHADVSKPQG